jgi:hypothetical protein
MITGLPHSEIPGSKCMCHSPRLIAACHVLHRLVSPRHSPTALVNLVFSINPKSPISILTLIYHPEMTFIISDVSFFKTLNFQRTYEVLSHLRKSFLFKIRMLLKAGLPSPRRMVGPSGLEPPTPRLSSVCSNQLSYEPPWRSNRISNCKSTSPLFLGTP